MNEVKLGAIADLISSNVDKKSRDDETPVRLVNYTDVYYGHVLNSDHDFMEATASSQQIERVGLRHGDVIFTKDSESPDDIGIPAIANSPDGDMICGYHLTIARPHPEFVFSKYLYWYLNSAQAKRHWEQTANGVTRFSIGFSATSALPVYLPPLPTQRAIAEYLDRETAEIDGMRADLDEMERLLTERRQSVKSGHFDSSVSHAAVKVKYLAIINTGSGDTQDAAKDGPYSFYVRSDKVLSSDQWDFNGPAVLTAGDGAGVGKIFHYAEGKFKVHQRVYCLHDFRNVDPLYFFNAFSYLLPKEVLYGGASSTVPSLRMHMLEDLQIPIPPLADQRRIADAIDRETAEIDSMLEDITKLRDLLAERRAAVISAAVTGQIDIPVSPTHKDEPHA